MTVKLVKQSFKTAREDGFTPSGLELIGLVSGSSDRPPMTNKAITEVNSKLVKNAEELGATHVYGIVYSAMAGSTYGGTMGYGDAYGPKKD
jgi:hypothetical protein